MRIPFRLIPFRSISAKQAALDARIKQVREAEKAAALAVPTVEAIVGQPLKNTNILAGKSDPITLSDEEYPSWFRKEVERPNRLDPNRFEKIGIPPTRTELRLLNRIKLRSNNDEMCV